MELITNHTEKDGFIEEDTFPPVVHKSELFDVSKGIKPTKSISSNWVIEKRLIEHFIQQKLSDEEFKSIMFDFSEYTSGYHFFEWFFLTFYQGSYNTPDSLPGHKDRDGKMKTSNFIVGGG